MSRLAAILAVLAFATVARGDETEAGEPRDFGILGEFVAPGEQRTLHLAVSEGFAGAEVLMPVTVTVGREPGSTLCLIAGVHGDELNGIEVVRRLTAELVPERMAGTVVAVPIVNAHGFRRGMRYLPDRRDLNRHFPGRRLGSAASRIAHSFFEQIVLRCDRLLDFHTGSLERTNLPHVRADLAAPGVSQLADALPGWTVLQHQGQPGTLRRAATDAGIPALTFEVGGPVRVDEEAVQRTLSGVRGIPGLGGPAPAAGPIEIHARSRWIRVDHGGLLLTRVVPGDWVRKGQVLGLVVDPVASHESEIHAPEAGRILGMAWNQVVLPGYAAFHLATAGAGDVSAPVEGLSSEEPPE